MFLMVQMEPVLNILNLMIVARILELKLFVFCCVATNVEKPHYLMNHHHLEECIKCYCSFLYEIVKLKNVKFSRQK